MFDFCDLCVSVLDTVVSLQKCAKPIEMAFGEGRGQILVYPSNIVLDRDAHWCHLVNRFERSVAGNIVSLCQSIWTLLHRPVLHYILLYRLCYSRDVYDIIIIHAYTAAMHDTVILVSSC